MKLRLDYFKSIGGKVAKGDGVIGPGGRVVEIGNFILAGAYNLPNHSDDKHFIESFAPRKNTGEQPCGDDVVSVALTNGSIKSGLAYNFEWTGAGARVVKSWKYDLESLIKMQAEHDAKEAEPVKPIYTQAMKDAGECIEIGMLYIDCDNIECELVGENNSVNLYVGRLTERGVHPKHLSVSQKERCKPIDTRTPKEKQVDEISALLSKSCLTTHVECVKLLQQKGLLAEIK